MGSTSAELTHVPLGPFDHWVPPGYVFIAHYLPLKAGTTTAQAFDLLLQGLQRLFSQHPWLSGEVGSQRPETPGWREGQLEIRHSQIPSSIEGSRLGVRQLRSKELTTDFDYETLREVGFPVDAFTEADLAPPSNHAGFFVDPDVTTCDVFSAQANFLPGGCVIVGAIHHQVCDQGSFYQIMSLWAGHCASLQTGGAPPKPFPADSHDRSLLRDIWAKERPTVSDPMAWRLVGLTPEAFEAQAQAPVQSSPEPKPAATVAQQSPKVGVFYLPAERFTALARDLSTELGIGSGVSVLDGLAALLWRCLLRARAKAMQASGKEIAGFETVLNQVNDGRPNFSPSMPPTYLGNLLYRVKSTLPVTELIDRDKTSLGAIATMLRRNGSVSSADLQSLMSLIEGLSSWKDIGKTTRTLADNILPQFISSLIGVPTDGLCFGDGSVFGNRGKVEAMRPFMDSLIWEFRFCTVAPKNKTGGVEFMANMTQDEYAFLMGDDEFTRYAMCLSWPED